MAVGDSLTALYRLCLWREQGVDLVGCLVKGVLRRQVAGDGLLHAGPQDLDHVRVLRDKWREVRDLRRVRFLSEIRVGLEGVGLRESGGTDRDAGAIHL